MGVILGFYRGFKGDKGKENGSYYSVYWGYLGVILGFYGDYFGIMEKKMETSIGFRVWWFHEGTYSQLVFGQLKV